MKLSLLGVEVVGTDHWDATRGPLTASVERVSNSDYHWNLVVRGGDSIFGNLAYGRIRGKAAAQRAVNEAAHAYLEEEAELREWHRSRNSPGSACYKSPRNQAQRAEGR